MTDVSLFAELIFGVGVGSLLIFGGKIIAAPGASQIYGRLCRRINC